MSKIIDFRYSNIKGCKDIPLEAAVCRRSLKKAFLKISLSSQENTCAGDSFLIKFQAEPATSLKKRFQHKCFPVNFVKFLRSSKHLRPAVPGVSNLFKYKIISQKIFQVEHPSHFYMINKHKWKQLSCFRF